MKSPRFPRLIPAAALLASVLLLAGCEELTRNTESILLPRFQRSDIFGFIAGLGTTFAVLPDLLAMLKRRSSAGMNPRMAAIIGCFQILWIYYGILIISRPVVVWNVIGVLINFTTVFAYRHFVKKERVAAQPHSQGA
jgi:MtN3 and saliva related transmembrane protein